MSLPLLLPPLDLVHQDGGEPKAKLGLYLESAKETNWKYIIHRLKTWSGEKPVINGGMNPELIIWKSHDWILEGTDLGLMHEISVKVLLDYTPLSHDPTSWKAMNEVLSEPQNMDICDLNDNEQYWLRGQKWKRGRGLVKSLSNHIHSLSLSSLLEPRITTLPSLGLLSRLKKYSEDESMCNLRNCPLREWWPLNLFQEPVGTENTHQQMSVGH